MSDQWERFVESNFGGWGDIPIPKFDPGPLEIQTSEVVIRELEVTIYPARRVEEWVTAGNYSHADQGDDETYTTDKIGKGFTVRKDSTEPYKAIVAAFSGGCERTDRNNALAARLALGLDPIGLEHLFAVGEQHPDLQRACHVVDLDFSLFYEVPRHHMSDRVAVVIHNRNILLSLTGNDRSRWIDKILPEDVFWGKDCFLGLKREAPLPQEP